MNGVFTGESAFPPVLCSPQLCLTRLVRHALGRRVRGAQG